MCMSMMSRVNIMCEMFECEESRNDVIMLRDAKYPILSDEVTKIINGMNLTDRLLLVVDRLDRDVIQSMLESEDEFYSLVDVDRLCSEIGIPSTVVSAILGIPLMYSVHGEIVIDVDSQVENPVNENRYDIGYKLISELMDNLPQHMFDGLDYKKMFNASYVGCFVTENTDNNMFYIFEV